MPASHQAMSPTACSRIEAGLLALAALDAAGVRAILMQGGDVVALTAAQRSRTTPAGIRAVAAKVAWHARPIHGAVATGSASCFEFPDGNVRILPIDPATPDLLLAIWTRAANRIHVAVDAARLTRRQSDVAHLVARGATTTEVASELGVSVNTVRRHLEAVHVRLGIRRRAELVMRFWDPDPAPLSTSA